MNSENIRVGMLGCGRVAQHYRLMLLEKDPVPEFAIVACCDVKAHQAEKMASEFDCSAYTDCKEMLDRENIDVVLILTPSGCHYENAMMVLNKGVSVLIEKPITLRPDHARELQKLAEEKSLVCASVFQNRYNPAVQALKAAFDEGRFKKIITAGFRLRWCRYQDYYEDEWHGRWAMDGGVISQQAIHHLDALRWICGPIIAVVASKANRVNSLEAEDTLTGLVRFENGALGTIEATTAARPRDFEASLSVVGEGGSVQIGGIALNEIVDWEFVEPQPQDKFAYSNFSEEVPSGYGLSHSRLLRDFAQAMRSGDSFVPITVSEAIPTIELVHALYASVESGKWVYLDDKRQYLS